MRRRERLIDAAISFDNEVCLKRSAIDNVCESVLKTIESELPEEAHSHQVYEFILGECKDLLNTKKIIL